MMKRLSSSAVLERASELPFAVERVRADFPILKQTAHGRPLVYLDNAATTHKPHEMITATSRFYVSQNSNIHRGVYLLSQEATALYEAARGKVQQFINAGSAREILFTRGTTESINLVANCYGRRNFRQGDEIIVTGMEHHSNIVPWQMICEQTGAVLRVVPLNDAGEIRLDEYRKLFTARTRFVSVVHVSNSLGTVNPVKEMVRIAHEQGVPILIDGAQWVAHGPTDVRDLDCDFYAFSGHKLYGPTGVGVLYGRAALLEAMPPYQGGGDMIAAVSFEKTTYAELPAKFEAGTPNIAGGIGLAAAIDYVQSIGFDAIAAHEADLLQYGTEKLSAIPWLRIIGTAKEKAGVISFVLEDPPLSILDVGVWLDAEGVAVRTGHHCCMPVMDRFHVPGTLRASFAMYNTRQEIDVLAAAIEKIRGRAGDRKPAPVAAAGDGVQWAPPAGDSPDAVADELAEVFEMLETRDARNEYVLELGRTLPNTFELLKQISKPVPGCMSEVYLVGRRAKGSEDRIEFLGDANAEIVRGLIAILQRLYSGQRSADVLRFDIEGFFRRIGLDQFISSQRRNGLAGMTQRLRSLAQNLGAPT